MTDTTEWFYATDKGERLKCTFDELVQLLKAKTISNGTLVWNAQMDEWKLLADLPDLYERLVMLGTADGEVVWHYVHTETKKQTGPVSALEMKNLRATGAVNDASLVWKPSLGNWTPLGQVEELKKIIGETGDAEIAEWFYVDAKREKQGPITFETLKSHYSSGALTESALIWKTGMGEWVKMSACEEPKIVKLLEKKKKKNKKKKKKWTNVQEHGNVYVAGLPRDVTLEEMQKYFSSCGVIKADLGGQPRIKIYRDAQNNIKGDGLVCFAHEASVNLAITLHDGADFRQGVKISVQKASFKQKGEYKATSLSTEQVEALKQQKLEQKKKLGWSEKGMVDKRRIVILKYMFTPDEAFIYPNFYNGIRMEVGTEIEAKCGRVEKLTVFEGSSEGVIAIKFVDPASAEACIQEMDGRWFAYRQISASYFDGTDYRVKETEEQKQERIKKFGDWLSQQQKANDAAQEEMLSDAVTEAVSIPMESDSKTRPAEGESADAPAAKRVKTADS